MTTKREAPATQGALFAAPVVQSPVVELMPEAAKFITEIQAATALPLGSVDVTAALLDGIPPGAALAALVAFIDPSILTPDQQLAHLAATERLIAWASAQQNRALVAYAGATPRETPYFADGHHHTLVDVRRTELARRLLWSEGSAHARLTNARTLAADLPSTSAALASGAMSMQRANVIADAARTLTALVDAQIESASGSQEHTHLEQARSSMLAELEHRCVRFAARHDLASTRSKARVAVAAIDPDGAAWRRASAQRERCAVTITHDDDAMSLLTATLPTEQAIECLQAIDATADDPAILDQHLPAGMRRARAMHGLLTGAIANGHAGGGTAGLERAGHPHRRQVRLDVTVSLETLLGLRDDTAIIAGAGPIPADVARGLLAESPEASIRWLVTDAAGVVTDISPREYRIGSGLRALVAARDGTCTAPNCSRRATRCQIDHVVPFDAGGESTPENLQPLCARHHQVKTHGGVRGFAEERPLPEAVLPSCSTAAPAIAARNMPSSVAASERSELAIRAREYGIDVDAPVLVALQDLRVREDIAVAAGQFNSARHIAREGALVGCLRGVLQRYHRRSCTRGEHAGACRLPQPPVPEWPDEPAF